MKYSLCIRGIVGKIKIVNFNIEKSSRYSILPKGFNYHIFDFEKAFIVQMQSADAATFAGNRVKIGKKKY